MGDKVLFDKCIFDFSQTGSSSSRTKAVRIEDSNKIGSNGFDHGSNTRNSSIPEASFSIDQMNDSLGPSGINEKFVTL